MKQLTECRRCLFKRHVEMRTDDIECTDETCINHVKHKTSKEITYDEHVEIENQKFTNRCRSVFVKWER